MKKLPINFAPRTPWWQHATKTAWLLLLFAVTCTALVSQQLIHIVGANMQMVAQLEALQSNNRARPPHAIAAPARLTTSSIQGINQAVDGLNVPWPQLFAALDTTIPKGVALISLEPDPSRQSLQLIAESATTDGMFATIAGLQKRPELGQARITRTQVDLQQAQRPVRFALDISWPLGGLHQP